MECTRWHKNQKAYLEVIWKENKTDDVICLHFGVYGNICGHMIPSSDKTSWIHSVLYAKPGRKKEDGKKMERKKKSQRKSIDARIDLRLS